MSSQEWSELSKRKPLIELREFYNHQQQCDDGFCHIY